MELSVEEWSGVECTVLSSVGFYFIFSFCYLSYFILFSLTEYSFFLLFNSTISGTKKPSKTIRGKDLP